MEHEGQRFLSGFLNSIYNRYVGDASSPVDNVPSPADNVPLPVDNVPLPAGNASSPGGDASPRRHLLVKARCLDKQIQYILLLPSWGIDPQLGNADAGTRRPQVRTRPPKKKVRTLPQCTYIYAWNERTYIYT